MDQRQRLEAQLAQHSAPMMPRGVQSGIQPTEDACSGNGAPAAGPVPAAPTEEDESYEVSLWTEDLCRLPTASVRVWALRWNLLRRTA